jgi:hypothetical protein
MRGFLAGLAVGAALGAGVTAALVGGRAADEPEAAAATAASVAATPKDEAPRGVRVRRSARADADAAAVDPAAHPAGVPGAKQDAAPETDIADPWAASIDDLLHAIAVRAGGRAAKKPTAGEITKAIRKRFPDHVFSVAEFRQLAAIGQSDAIDDAFATWSEEFALGEFRRVFASADPEDRRERGWLGSRLVIRQAPLPSDLCNALLRNDDPQERRVGAWWVTYTDRPDVARLVEMAAADPSPDVRAAAIEAVPRLVETKKASPDAFRQIVLDAARGPDEQLRDSAYGALASIGPEGPRLALEILARDGGGMGDTESLVTAAVDGGCAADVLALHLGRSVDAIAANVLTSRVDEHPELLRGAKDLLPALRAALDRPDNQGDLQTFVAATARVFGTDFASQSALDRNSEISARAAAVDALLGDAKTWAEGHELARRILADRTEPAGMRWAAIDLVATCTDNAESEAAVRTENRAFFTELLRDEPNVRIKERLKTYFGD